METVVRMKIAYLMSLSIMTKILSNPDDEGNSGVKYIDTTSKG